jgi:hypothetical protein
MKQTVHSASKQEYSRYPITIVFVLFLHLDEKVNSITVVAHQTQQADSKDVLEHLSAVVDIAIHVVPTEREVVLECLCETHTRGP